MSLPIKKTPFHFGDSASCLLSIRRRLLEVVSGWLWECATVESGCDKNIAIAEERVWLVIKLMHVYILSLSLCMCAHQPCSFSCYFLHKEIISALEHMPIIAAEVWPHMPTLTLIMICLNLMFYFLNSYCKILIRSSRSPLNHLDHIFRRIANPPFAGAVKVSKMENQQCGFPTASRSIKPCHAVGPAYTYQLPVAPFFLSMIIEAF